MWSYWTMNEMPTRTSVQRGWSHLCLSVIPSLYYSRFSGNIDLCSSFRLSNRIYHGIYKFGVLFSRLVLSFESQYRGCSRDLHCVSSCNEIFLQSHG